MNIGSFKCPVCNDITRIRIKEVNKVGNTLLHTCNQCESIFITECRANRFLVHITECVINRPR